MLAAEQYPEEKKHQQVQDDCEDPGLEHQDSNEPSEKDFSDPSTPSCEAKEVDSRFIDRFNAIPLVAESVDYVQKYANSDDGAYSKYVKFALNKAESGIQTVTGLAEAKFPTQVEAADHMAVSTLDFLEDKFPNVLKQSASDVLKQSRQAISDIVKTPQAALTSTIDSIASNAEGILDRLLPPSEEEEKVEETERDVGVARLRHVGEDASRRLSQAVRNLSNNSKVLNLSESNQFFQRAAEEMAALSEKIQAAVSNTKDNVSSIKDSSLQYLLKSQAQLVQRVNAEIDAISVYLKGSTEAAPQDLRNKLEPAVKFFSERYAKVSAELQNDQHPLPIKARNALLLATDSIPIIDDACRYLTSFLGPSDQE